MNPSCSEFYLNKKFHFQKAAKQNMITIKAEINKLEDMLTITKAQLLFAPASNLK